MTNNIYARKELMFQWGNNKYHIIGQQEVVMSAQQGDVREAQETGNVTYRGQQRSPW